PESARQRTCGSHADAEAGVGTGPYADSDRVEIVQRDSRTLADLDDRGHQLARVRRRAAQRADVGDVLVDGRVIAHDGRAGGGRRGVEAEHGHSMAIDRLSPPACAMSTWAATRSSRESSAGGHSTNPIRSSVR